MKILIAMDGSECSLAALDAFLARRTWFRDAKLELVYVHPAIPYPGAAARAGKAAVGKHYAEESDEALAPALDRLAKSSAPHTTTKLVGDAAEEIVRHAKAGHTDLIVMGTHGKTGMRNLLMGSVATKVLAGTTTPVLLFK